MLYCYYCGESIEVNLHQHDNDDGSKKELSLQGVDFSDEGFWCDYYDGFTYFEKQSNTQHKFTLLLEDKTKQEIKLNINSSIKFKKNLSPLRYPGGKSRLIHFLYQYLQTDNTNVLVSPFTGGGSFEIALLEAGVVEELHLNDIDFGVYSLWWTMKHAPFALVDKIRQNTTPTHTDFFHAQKLIKNDFSGVDSIEAAWATLLVNRLAYSGISKANPLGGKKGTSNSLLARWNPEKIIKKIEKIHSLSDRISITSIDAIEFIEATYWWPNTTIFIDPPYVEKGAQLYNHSYQEQDHLKLSIMLDELHKGMPGADILLTYDYSKWLQELYEYPATEVIGRQYSI